MNIYKSKNSSYSLREEVKRQDGKEWENLAHLVSVSRFLFLVSPSLLSPAKERLVCILNQHTIARYKCFCIRRNTTKLAIRQGIYCTSLHPAAMSIVYALYHFWLHLGSHWESSPPFHSIWFAAHPKKQEDKGNLLAIPQTTIHTTLWRGLQFSALLYLPPRPSSSEWLGNKLQRGWTV